MKQTIQVADKPTADEIKSTVESNAEKLDGIAQQLESGGMLADPEHGLAALKQHIDELKNYVGNGKRDVANAITAKGVTTATDASFATLVDNIDKIVTLMQGTQDADVAAGDILFGKYCYAKGARLMGTMPIRGAVNKSLAPNGSYTIPEGYHNGSGKVVQNLETRAAQTYTPGTANQTIPAGRFLTGAQTILGDANLIPANIAKGKSIFGVAGSHEAGMQFRADCTNYDHHLVHEAKLATFMPYSKSGSFTAPNGTTVPYTLKFNNYNGPESVLLFVKPDGITVNNVVAIKTINYSRGSVSGYIYFRSEHVFSWDNPLVKASFTVPGPSGGNAALSGKGMLAVQFPSPAPNDEYTSMNVNYVEAYYY